MNKLCPALMLGAMLGITACDSDDSDEVINMAPAPVAEAHVRVIHAGIDAPKVNVMANDTQLLADVDYGISSGFLTVPAGLYDIDVDAQIADGSLLEVLSADLDLSADMEYTAVALGKVSDDTLQLKLVANASAAIAAGYARVQVLHGASDVGLVDVYVTAPGADISNTAPHALG